MRSASGHLWSLGLLVVLAACGSGTPEEPVEPGSDLLAGIDMRGFSTDAIDRSVDACTNFYQFACGGWRQANDIPADQPAWGRFNELVERNREILRRILEQAAAPRPDRTALEQKIGDYYAACMDEAAVEARGAAPLADVLARIAALDDVAAIAPALAALHGLGVNALFEFGSEQDFKDAASVIAIADQGGLGLPERDYYLRDDEKSREIRDAYRTHVERMLGLLGDPPAAAARAAETVMRIETALARASLGVVERRDPNNIYHRMTRDEIVALTPRFDWNAYLSALEAPAVTAANVTVPAFFAEVNRLLDAEDPAAWRTYLRWHALRANAFLLSKPFVEENFDFYGRTLTGATELRPRWKRCVQYVDADLGEALGRPFVDATFGEDGKRMMIELVEGLEDALERDIQSLPWMTDETRARAREKLDAIRNKIGYPDRWRDYSSLQIARDDLLGNSHRANRFELARQLAKIGRPLDRGEWAMSPPTVNAYYNPLMNDINFPAGILQPPFFDRSMDDAVNYGAVGAVIGHEMTHGFDDQGRQFDAAGNLRDWWTEADSREFQSRAACFVEQYGAYTAVDEIPVNGQLTLGENVADNGGLRIAYLALLAKLAQQGERPGGDGFTPEQRFFLGWGQVWCENRRTEFSRMLAQTDPHAPGEHRVNGVVSNMPEFAEAFGCADGAPMVRETVCRIW